MQNQQDSLERRFAAFEKRQALIDALILDLAEVITSTAGEALDAADDTIEVEINASQTEAAEPLTKEDLQSAMIDLSASKGREVAKGIVDRFAVHEGRATATLSDIPEDKYAEAMAAVREAEAA